MSGSTLSIKPSMAWLFLFFPALGYYMATRLRSIGLFQWGSYGTVVATELAGFNCLSENNLIYLSKDCSQLIYPLYLVDDSFDDIVATAWKHDDELGRGFLLLSTSFGKGKIWQWETGGGPIAIGRTLHLQDSGCRSDFHLNCTSSDNLGSGGIAVDTWHEPSRLIVAEWGEGRIARLEENGARTPMVIQIPEIIAGDSEEKYTVGGRVRHPFKLLLSPLGDMLILDSFGKEVDCLFRVPHAAKFHPALQSLAASRKAHSWEHINATDDKYNPQLLMQATHLGGISLEPNQWLRMYITMKQNDRIVLVRLSLEEIEDDDQDNENAATQPPQSTIVLDYSEHTSEPRAVEIDEKGNVYLVVDDGILLVDDSGNIVGKVTMNISEKIVDLTIGEDRFLYVTTSTKLMRLRIKNAPLTNPTDLLLHS